MKKLAVLGAGAIAAATVALISPSVADSEPASAASLNVVGETFARAVAILKSQGIKATFNGGVGSDYPQPQCIVDEQKPSGNKYLLHVNCTTKAVLAATDNTPAGAGAGGPRVGGNGVTTVQATPVGPQPGMSVPGA